MLLHRREPLAWCECAPFSILQPISLLLAETRAGSGDCTLPRRRWWRRCFCALVSRLACAHETRVSLVNLATNRKPQVVATLK